MAGKKLSGLPEFPGEETPDDVLAADDLFLLTDKSDLSSGANGTSKRIAALRLAQELLALVEEEEPGGPSPVFTVNGKIGPNVVLTADDVDADAFGVAAANMDLHKAAADPHPQYLRTEEADDAYSVLGHTHTFASLTSKPTTLGGYGITDADPLGAGLGAVAAHVVEPDPHGQYLLWLQAENQYAPLASPPLTGTPTAPTAAPGTNTTQLATTQFVTAAVAAGGGGTPTQLVSVDGYKIFQKYPGVWVVSGGANLQVVELGYSGGVGQIGIHRYFNSDSDFERLKLGWSGTDAIISTDAANPGVARNIRIAPGGGTVFIDGNLYVNTVLAQSGIATDVVYNYASSLFVVNHNNGMLLNGSNPAIVIGSTLDVGLVRDGTNILKVTNGSTGFGRLNTGRIRADGEGVAALTLSNINATGQIYIDFQYTNFSGSYGNMGIDAYALTWNFAFNTTFKPAVNCGVCFGANVGASTTQAKVMVFPDPGQAAIYSQGPIQFAATAGGTPANDTAHIYANNVGGTTEVFVRDEIGNDTQISPHAMDAPGALNDAAGELAYMSKEVQHYLGYVRYLNVARTVYLMEELLKAIRQGRTLPQIAAALTGKPLDLYKLESFAAHNARTGADLVQKSWTEEQDKHQAAYDANRAADLARHAEWEQVRDKWPILHEAEQDAHDGWVLDKAAWETMREQEMEERDAWAASGDEGPPPPVRDVFAEPEPKVRGEFNHPEPSVRPDVDIRKPIPPWLAQRGVQ